MRSSDAGKLPYGTVRGLVFAALCISCLAVTSGAVIVARARASEAAPPVPSMVTAGADAFAEWRQHPYLVFRSTALDDSYGKVAVVPLDHPTGPRYLTSLQFTIWRDGARFQSADFNFWGVTFSGVQGHFFATLGTGGTTYLIEGDVATREATVLLENVECPSLSPDGTRLVFKQRRGGSRRQPIWRLAVLDLATLRWSPLAAESRSIDDQVEWLDNERILYGLSDEPGVFSLTNVWVLAIDGGGPARVFIPQAWSPAVVR